MEHRISRNRQKSAISWNKNRQDFYSRQSDFYSSAALLSFVVTRRLLRHRYFYSTARNQENSISGHISRYAGIKIMVAQDEKYSLLLAVFHDSLATKIFGGFSSIFFPFSAEGS